MISLDLILTIIVKIYSTNTSNDKYKKIRMFKHGGSCTKHQGHQQLYQ
jgi:hypothetical protein